ncbi:MAG: hypothetical protein OXN25_23080 [Candidatus Poribacteria bacterium]|nr:hypothetical protein [Candidatus Poribacteria bacterium]MDE0427751.1 hypothetical protein [Candidatus Poribacteria bacterium]
MRSNSKGRILAACEMSFKGRSNAEIASHFKVTDSTVSRWRRLELWIDFEKELVAAYKAAALQKHQGTDADTDPA